MCARIRRTFPHAVICVAAAILLAGLAGCSSVYMKGTPLYTGEYTTAQAPAEDRVNLWPLVYYHKPALSVLWPLAEKTDDHFALRPLFSMYKLDEEEHQYSVLWPLSQFDFDENLHWIFPLFWGGDGKGKLDYMTLFPLLWWSEPDDFVLFPLLWYDGLDQFTVFPFLWYSEDDYFALFPLFMHFQGDGGDNSHALWPVFNYRNIPGDKGWRVWPLVGQYKSVERRYRYALWPVLHDWRSETSSERYQAAFPLYFRYRYKNEGADLILPLLWRDFSPGESRLFTPLYSSAHDGDDFWRLAFPLFFQRRADDNQTVVTPLVGRSWSPKHNTWSFIPLASWFRKADAERDLWLLGPVAHFNWGTGISSSHVFPFYYYDGIEDIFISPLVSGRLSDDDGFVNVLGPLFNYSWQSDGTKLWFAPFPLVSGYTNPNDRGSCVFPLYHYNRDVSDGERSGFALWPFFHYAFKPDGKRFEVFPLFKHRRDSTSCDDYLFPLWSYSSDTTPHPQKDFSLLGWLYDYRRRVTPREKGEGKDEYVRSRVLWRLMHYERRNSHKTLDLFPFITYDRERDTGFRKFSFAWRFIRYERKRDGGLDLDLLYIPLRRSR